MEAVDTDKWLKVCRLCLNRKDNLVSLFEHNEITKQSMADVINYVLGVKVTARDDIPSCVCRTCLGKVKFALPFKKICMASDSQLKGIPFHKTAFGAAHKSLKSCEPSLGLIEKSYCNEVTTSQYEYSLNEEKKCRLCLKAEHSVLSLFENAPTQDVTLNELVSFTLGIKASIQDEFPKSICSLCAGKLYVLNDFKKQFLDSARILFLSLEPKFGVEDDLAVSINSNKLLVSNQEVVVKAEVDPEDLPGINTSDSQTNLQHCTECHSLSCDNDQHPCISCQSPLSNQVPSELPSPLNNHPSSIDLQPNPVNIQKDKIEVKLAFLKEQKFSVKMEDLPIWGKGGKRYKCGVCAKELQSKVAAVHHVNMHFSANLFMLQCKKKMQRLQDYFSCGLCSRIYTTKDALRRHIRTHGEKKFCCEKCPSKFHNVTSLKSHARSHSSEKPFLCKACPMKFKTREQLRSHVDRHEGNRRYLCDKCPKLFYSKHLLGRHELTHSGEKPHSCPVCSRKFSLKVNLTYHMRTHTGEKPYTCAHCLRSFSMKCSLGEHTKIHSGERPFPCGTCGKSFKSTSTMRKHEATHMKPYHKCSMCFRCFPHKKLLQAHKSTHKRK